METNSITQNKLRFHKASIRDLAIDTLEIILLLCKACRNAMHFFSLICLVVKMFAFHVYTCVTRSLQVMWNGVTSQDLLLADILTMLQCRAAGNS